jgi:hypothetical protein
VMFKLGKVYRFNGSNAAIWQPPFEPGEMSVCIEVLEETDTHGIPLCRLMTKGGPFLLTGAHSRYFTEVA